MDEPTPPQGVEATQQTQQQAPNGVIAGLLVDQAQGQQQQAPINWREMITDGGEFSDGWLDKLPEEQRGTLQGTKDLPSLLKRVVDLRKAASAKAEGMVKVPGDGATADDVAAWNKAVGVPEKPEDYAFSMDSVPEPLRDNELAKGYVEAAHKAGLPTAQVKQLGEWFNGAMVARHEAQQAEMADWQKTQIADVVKHFGGDHGAASAAVKGILSEAESYGIDPAGADLLSAGVWRYVADLRSARDAATAKVAALTQPDKATGQARAAPSSFADLDARVTAIFQDARYGVDKAWTADAEQSVNKWAEMKRSA